MNIFDNALVQIYNLMERFVSLIERAIGKDFINSFTRLLDQMHATAVIVSAVIVLISGVSAYIQFKELFSWALYVALGAPLVLLILSFFAESFHDACEDLISSNETTLSNGAYLRLAAVISFLSSIALFIGGIFILVQGLGINISIGMWVGAFVLLLSAAPFFNPSLLNISITKGSSSGEDFIALISLNLKALVFFEKIISRLLIVGGGICLIGSLFQVMPYLVYGLGLLAGGIAFPIIIYLLFLFFYFFYSLLLSFLSIGRISSDRN